MLRFGVSVVEMGWQKGKPWYARVVAVPDDYGRLEDTFTFGPDKVQAWAALAELLADACGVSAEEIALDEMPAGRHRRRVRRRH